MENLPRCKQQSRLAPALKETRKGNDGLLDFGFLVRDMLASLWIELDDFDFFRRGPLVFGRSIEMTGTRGGFQFDFFSASFSHNKNLSKKRTEKRLRFFRREREDRREQRRYRVCR